MKVSILVPVYKVERYIEECIRSLFEQTYEDIEYVFVDDCSPDNSINILKQVAKEYPDRQPFIQIISNDENKGIGETRKILINNATGDYLLFVDSDDYIDRAAIETFAHIAEQEHADIVMQNYYELRNGQLKKVQNAKFNDNKELLDLTIKRGRNSIDALWKLFIRREIFTTNNILFPSINWFEDWILSLQLFYYAKKIVATDEAFYYYRANDNSITHNRYNFIDDRIKAIDLAVAFLKEKNIYDEFHDSMLECIFVSKQCYLIDKHCIDINRYMEYYPEANSIWRKFNYGSNAKILFWLAEHRMSFLLKLILR